MFLRRLSSSSVGCKTLNNAAVHTTTKAPPLSLRFYSSNQFFEQVTPTFFRHKPSQHQPDTPLALFDFDWTLCATRSGRILPLFPKDVRLIYPADVYQEKIPWNTHRVVIVTNQTRLQKEFEARVSWFLEEIGKDCEVWMSTDFDKYRVPATGMWDHAVGKNTNPLNSFYVGKRGGRAKDISCADRVFSWNTRINYYTPEEYFIDEPKEDYAFDGLVEEYLKDRFSDKEGLWDSGKIHWARDDDQQELVIFVGWMTSGKSFISQRYFGNSQKYDVLDLTDIPTKTEQNKEITQALESGRSAVLDMNLPTEADRKRVLKLAKSVSPQIRVRCVHVEDVDEKLSFHLDMYREKVAGAKHFSTASYKSYAKKFVPPSESEGFDEIQRVEFAPSFEDPEDRRLFYQSVSA